MPLLIVDNLPELAAAAEKRLVKLQAKQKKAADRVLAELQRKMAK